MTDDKIKAVFEQYGQYVSGKDYALIRAVEAVVAPQRTWVGLTDEQISNLWCKVSNTDFVTADTHVFARAIEAAHGTKG